MNDVEVIQVVRTRLTLAGGVEGCTSPKCRRSGPDGVCMGYHCPKCGEPCSMMGHGNCEVSAA